MFRLVIGRANSNQLSSPSRRLSFLHLYNPRSKNKPCTCSMHITRHMIFTTVSMDPFGLRVDEKRCKARGVQTSLQRPSERSYTRNMMLTSNVLQARDRTGNPQDNISDEWKPAMGALRRQCCAPGLPAAGVIFGSGFIMTPTASLFSWCEIFAMLVRFRLSV